MNAPPGVPSEARWVKVDRVTDGDHCPDGSHTRPCTRYRRTRAGSALWPNRYGALEYMVARGVYLVEVEEDRYGCLVGQLYRSKDGYDINASMVCAGYVRWYTRYVPDSQALNDCQVEAQLARWGLWEKEDPLPPWKWRRR